MAGNRQKAVARVAYIIKYSIAKVYAAKFKLRTVAGVFKISGSDLRKPIGKREKSVIGVDQIYTQKKGKDIQGILYDRYHKIPAPKGNKLKQDWKPEFLIHLEKSNDLQEFYTKFWNLKR
jgi:Type II intron maturase